MLSRLKKLLPSLRWVDHKGLIDQVVRVYEGQARNVTMEIYQLRSDETWTVYMSVWSHKGRFFRKKHKLPRASVLPTIDTLLRELEAETA